MMPGRAPGCVCQQCCSRWTAKKAVRGQEGGRGLMMGCDAVMAWGDIYV